MKNPRGIALALAFAALAAGAPTAAAAPILIGLHADASSPAHDFGDAAELGFQGALSGTWMLGSGWGVGADVGYQRWGGSDEMNGLFRTGDEFSGATNSQAEVRFKAIQLTAHGLYRYPTTNGKVLPWLKGGLGLYVLSSDLANAQVTSLDASKSYFGFNVGAGIDFAVGPAYALGIEAGYQRIELGELPASFADFDQDNWYVLFFEQVETFTFGVNLTWGPNAR